MFFNRGIYDSVLVCFFYFLFKKGVGISFDFVNNVLNFGLRGLNLSLVGLWCLILFLGKKFYFIYFFLLWGIDGYL